MISLCSQGVRSDSSISLISLISLCVSAQAPTPALSPPALESFPPAARQVIEPAHRNAVAHPTDAAAVGALGRALHAWEQWGAAHEAYARAAAIAPRAFEWRYLDAVVLQRLARHAEAAVQLREALSLSPDYLAARVKLAEALLESASSGKARRAFARSPASQPRVQPPKSGSDASPRPKGSTTRPSNTSPAP